MTPLIVPLLLLACGGSAPAPAPAPQAAPVPEGDAAPAPAKAQPDQDPMAEVCKAVITANDATAIYQVGRGIKTDDGCTFEDVAVEHSLVKLAFEKADGTKAWATLHPKMCVKTPPEGAVVQDPWVLEIPEASKAMCPKGFEKLTAAVVTGAFPNPSTAR